MSRINVGILPKDLSRLRGYNVTYFGSAWDNVPPNMMGDYVPCDKDIEIVKRRIVERS